MNTDQLIAYYRERPHYWRAFHIRRWTIVFPMIEKAKDVLDVGCGYGDLHWVLTANGVVVPYTGIDIVPEHIQFARDQDGSGEWVLGEFLAYDFGGRTWDTVVSVCQFSGEGLDEESVRASIRKMWSLTTGTLVVMENAFHETVKLACWECSSDAEILESRPANREDITIEVLVCLKR